MIIPNQCVETRWINTNKEHLISKGYAFTNYLDRVVVRVEDLPPTSTYKIAVRCDYCQKEYYVQFFTYFTGINRTGKTCCRNCVSKVHIKLPISKVLERFTTRGYYPLFTEYVNARSKLKFFCLKHPSVIQDITLDNLYEGKGCKICGLDSRSGSNSPNWKGGITPENNRLRSSKEYTQWRTYVFKRDAFTCIKCGTLGGKLEAHHINDWSNNPEGRFDTANGITLCKSCHTDFHSQHGKKLNTKYQLLTFLLYK